MTVRKRDEIDTGALPGMVRGSLYAILLVAGLASLPFIGQYGPLPTTTLLDAWILLFISTCLLRGRTHTTGLLLLLAGYLLTRIIPAVYTQAPLEDFAQAYRWLLYLVAFAFAIGKQWIPIAPLVKVMWALLLMAVAKAAATFLLFGSGQRPGLLLENNFELALFAGMIAALYGHLGRGRWWAVATLGALTLLSGSRSGALAFLILALFAVTQAGVRNLFVRYLMLLAVPLLVMIPVTIFSARSAQSTNIDRLNFLNVFLADVQKWDLVNWLFGTVPITPLSPGACHTLSYYDRLFSSVGDGSCYAVILHAFVLRVIFDAGIVGLLIAFGVTWYVLRRGQVQTLLTVTLLAIALTNSLSVSGLNNPYVALPILIAIVTASVASEPPRERNQPRTKKLAPAAYAQLATRP